MNLIAEMKYIPHINNFEEFHKDYYNKLFHSVSEEDKWVLTVLPNPYLNMNKLSFKKFYIGLVGRFITYTMFLYGDPATLNIGYNIYLYDNLLELQTCQYILLENYSLFQREEERSQKLT